SDRRESRHSPQPLGVRALVQHRAGFGAAVRLGFAVPGPQRQVLSMRVILAGCLLAATLIGLSPRTTAQEQGVEERLRETLRRTMVELRSLQDSQTALQAKLEEAQKQRDQAQQAVQELTA